MSISRIHCLAFWTADELESLDDRFTRAPWTGGEEGVHGGFGGIVTPGGKAELLCSCCNSAKYTVVGYFEPGGL
jgi:hypothetical protein